MFKTISRLIFGGEEEVPEDVRTKELEEEGWHVVTHQEAASAENPDVAVPDIQPSGSSLCGSTAANTGADCNSDAEAAGLDGGDGGATTRAVPAASFQPKALAEVSRLTCVQKARAWAHRHCASRNAIQRHNRLRQGVQAHAFQLQQPGHRSLCH